MNESGPMIVIDAREPNAHLRLYSISLFERILRQIHESGHKDALVLSEIPIETFLRPDFKPRFNVNLFQVRTDMTENALSRLARTERFIYLDAGVAFDLSIVQRILRSDDDIMVLGPSGQIRGASLRTACVLKGSGDLRQRLEASRGRPDVKTYHPDDLKEYNRLLRRSVTPRVWEPKSPENLQTIENEMYADTFKGTMEWIAIYGYRIPVRALTKLAAKTRITPNQLTTAAIGCSFLAIPVFFVGLPELGLMLAAAFILLDSLDGKLARMTIRFSHAADRWDHLTSHPTRVAWYFGLGWTLCEHDLTSLMGLATLIYASMPVVDKLTGVLFNAKFGRSPLDYTPLDKKVHLFTVRRNDIFLMLVSLPFGFLPEVYLFCTAWAVATWLWHAFRLIWFSLRPLSNTSPAV